MLVPDNVHPELTVYYNGALVLSVIQERGIWNLLDLYFRVRAMRSISMPVFVLCLDWLFLLELIRHSDGGGVEVCT